MDEEQRLRMPLLRKARCNLKENWAAWLTQRRRGKSITRCTYKRKAEESKLYTSEGKLTSPKAVSVFSSCPFRYSVTMQAEKRGDFTLGACYCGQGAQRPDWPVRGRFVALACLGQVPTLTDQTDDSLPNRKETNYETAYLPDVRSSYPQWLVTNRYPLGLRILARLRKPPQGTEMAYLSAYTRPPF